REQSFGRSLFFLQIFAIGRQPISNRWKLLFSKQREHMKLLNRFAIAAFAMFAGVTISAAQSRPYPSGDLQKTDARLLQQIDNIPIYDHHSHRASADRSERQ